MSNYRKKELPITAFQWDGENTNDIASFAEAISHTPTGSILIIETKTNVITLKKGDYVYREGKNTWGMTQEAFESLYEKEGE